MDKLCSLRDAIARDIENGMSIAMGCALESLIPFAASHEIIRQKKRRLTLIAPISDMQFDQLIGAGCVQKIVASWVGNVAAAMGVPFLPTRTVKGSDFARDPQFARVACPFTAEELIAVRAIRPDAAILHVQRADREGNAQAWGNLGVVREAAMAAKKVILTCEEIVEREVIL